MLDGSPLAFRYGCRTKGLSKEKEMLRRIYRVFVVSIVLFILTLSTWASSEIEDFIGITWYWQRTLLNDDTVFTPAQPAQYTLTFHDDDTIAAQVDCNRMGGTFVREHSSLSIELTHGTRAMCPPDSLDTEFQRQIYEVRQMVFDGNALHLDLTGHRGTMSFTR